MKNKSETIAWLNSHFNPVQCFTIEGVWYGIIAQNKDEYSIKAVEINDCEFAPDEGAWIIWPESRFETLGGAYYAILLNAGSEK